MKHRLRRIAILVSIFSVAAPLSFAKIDIRGLLEYQSPAAPQASEGSASSNAVDAPAKIKKTKKVWTNENLTDVSGSPISQIGDAKNGVSRKSAAAKTAGSQMAVSFRKRLAAFQTQLADMDTQIADLKSFAKGESSRTSGLQMHKSYTMEPVQDQILKLEERRKIVAAKMDAVFDAARKRGIEPGQLR